MNSLVKYLFPLPTKLIPFFKFNYNFNTKINTLWLIINYKAKGN